MTRFRRLLPLLVLLVGSIVVVQALDLVGCPDETGALHQAEHTAARGALSDCLCHLTFADTALSIAVADEAGPRVQHPDGTVDWQDAGVRTRLERPPRG